MGEASRYDDEGQNVGDENVGVELDGVQLTLASIADPSLLQPDGMAPTPGYCRFSDIGRFDLTCCRPSNQPSTPAH